MVKYAVVFSSQTGNTALLAERIKKVLPEDMCQYAGTPDEKALAADLIFAGFWTDKGSCDASMVEFLKGLHNKTVFLFGTAGFGGSEDYFARILSNVEKYLDESNTLAGSYMCQGKMQMAVRRRYEAMAEKDPQKGQQLLDNFDLALTHPDVQDLEGLERTVRKVWLSENGAKQQ